MQKFAIINCANVGDSEQCILFLADWTTLRPDPDTHLHRTGCHKCVTYFLRIHSAITIVAVALSMRILSSTGLGSPQTFFQWFLTLSGSLARPRDPSGNCCAFLCDSKIMTPVSPLLRQSKTTLSVLPTDRTAGSRLQMFCLSHSHGGGGLRAAGVSRSVLLYTVSGEG